MAGHTASAQLSRAFKEPSTNPRCSRRPTTRRCVYIAMFLSPVDDWTITNPGGCKNKFIGSLVDAPRVARPADHSSSGQVRRAFFQGQQGYEADTALVLTSVHKPLESFCPCDAPKKPLGGAIAAQREGSSVLAPVSACGADANREPMECS